MRYKIEWTQLQGYYTHIEAETPGEALEKFHAGEHPTPEEDDFCQMEEDSVNVVPAPEI